ncbi:class I adenylate-forming enzyme family protein [Hydrogenophaga palleronii]|uniref:class I adenylate-forming enzyme family protein n=1 Tax=Hydrogenophaga palleronii TaxID=65655 RepID=UPI000824F582|nr:class I adenylate-forming enzyme family protein [Hydrogenophaga palleronii]
MTAARIHDLFDRCLRRSPDRVFLHLPANGPGAAAMTYAQLDGMARALEVELRRERVRPGDRVMAVAENCPQHIALILACSRMGAWSCGVNARMAPGEVDGFAAKADARICYFTTGVSEYAAAHADRSCAMPSTVAGLSRSPVRSEAIPESGPLAERVAAIIFTSGTSGSPKGVMMTHEGVTHFARVSAQSRALAEDDRSYAYLPMTHIFGLGTVLMASLHAGAALLMRTSFDPSVALNDLARHGVTQLQGPPALFARLLGHVEQHGDMRCTAPDLRYVYAGAGPLDMSLKRRVEAAFDLPLHHGYGLSEYAGSLYMTRRGERRDDTSCGHAVEGAEVRIVDPATGSDVPVGQRGEIWLRGVGLMPGYFRDVGASCTVMRDGWYMSGDIGEVGRDGALFVVGRLKEMIIRSGFNVYPAEIEAVLNGFESIERSAVVGHGVADGNEDIVAYVQLVPGAVLDEPALRAHLAHWLAPYKQPGQIVVMKDLPMTATGKVLKRRLLPA